VIYAFATFNVAKTAQSATKTGCGIITAFSRGGRFLSAGPFAPYLKDTTTFATGVNKGFLLRVKTTNLLTKRK